VIISYAVIGAIMASVYACLSVSVEAAAPSSTAKKLLGLRNRSSYFVVAKLSALFTLDAFAGGEPSHICAGTGRAPAHICAGTGLAPAHICTATGLAPAHICTGTGLAPAHICTATGLTAPASAPGFSTQTFIVLWFSRRWLTDPSLLGVALMVINLLAAASGLIVGPLVARFGAVKVMVFTHLPSNVLNMLVPLMPSQPLAIGILLLRFSISQMDVPARQARFPD
jgi:hypothetical protein